MRVFSLLFVVFASFSSSAFAVPACIRCDAKKPEPVIAAASCVRCEAKVPVLAIVNCGKCESSSFLPSCVATPKLPWVAKFTGCDVCSDKAEQIIATDACGGCETQSFDVILGGVKGDSDLDGMLAGSGCGNCGSSNTIEGDTGLERVIGGV